MKKLLLFLTVPLLFFAFLIVKVNAWEESVDQQNTTITTGYVTIGTYNHNQTFTPTQDHITKVQFYLKNRVLGDTITVVLMNEETSTNVFSIVRHINDDGDGWEVLNLAAGVNPDGYTISPGTLYSLWLEVDNSTTGWIRSGSNAYGEGTRRQGTTEKTDDFAFATFGYTEEVAPEPEGEPEVEPDSDSSPDSDDTSDDTASEDLSEESDDTELEEDETLTKPTLMKVKVNDQNVELPISQTLELNNNDTLYLEGTAFDDAKVVLFIGDKSFSTTADSDGIWNISISVSYLKAGEQTVKAQTQGGEDKGSKVAEFFRVEVQEEVKTDLILAPIQSGEPMSLPDRLTKGDLRFVSILLLLIAGTSLIAVLYKIRKGKKMKDEEIVKTEPATESKQDILNNKKVEDSRDKGIGNSNEEKIQKEKKAEDIQADK